MALIFHERVGLDGRRISPFSWRIRYALAHKGLDPEVVPTRFADVARIRALSGQHFVPIIEDDGQVVHDSWSIACHLEDRFPDRPSLFGGAIGRGAARLVNIWSDTVLGRAMRRQIYADFIWCIDPGDRAYFRRSRETQLGMTLGTVQRRSRRGVAGLLEACAPLERTLSEQPFLAGPVAGLCRLRRVLGVPVGAHRQPARCAARCDEDRGDACLAGAHGGAVR